MTSSRTQGIIATRHAHASSLHRHLWLTSSADVRAPDRVLLKDYLVQEWLPAIQLDVEPTTFRSLADHVTSFIVPHLGDIAVSDLAHNTIRSFHRELLHTPCRRGTGLLKKTTVIRIHGTLSWALQALTETGRIPFNPAWGAKPRLRKSELYEPRVWSPQHLCEFLSFVATDELEALWKLLAMTGMRRNEALGLQWGDFSDRYRRVSVRRALSKIDRTAYISAPKSARARGIDLDLETSQGVQRHRRHQIRERSSRRLAPIRTYDFIFMRRDQEPLEPCWVSKKFRKLVLSAGLPAIRLHDLRHTHATHLLLAGANPKAVQERLGHADILTTLDTYAHLIPTIQGEAVKKLHKFYRTISRE